MFVIGWMQLIIILIKYAAFFKLSYIDVVCVCVCIVEYTFFWEKFLNICIYFWRQNHNVVAYITEP